MPHLLLCPRCLQAIEPGGARRCRCAARPVRLARSDHDHLFAGVIRIGVRRRGGGISLEAFVPGPGRIGSSAWIESREHHAGSVWLWQAHQRDLPGRFEGLGCSPEVGARLRALELTDVLVAELVGNEEGCDESARDLCALLARRARKVESLVLVRAAGALSHDVRGALASVAARLEERETVEAALAGAVSGWSGSSGPPVDPGPAARDLLAACDLGGPVATELVSQIHAATTRLCGWRPGGPVPPVVRFPGSGPAARGRGLRAIPSASGLLWGAFQLARGVPPASGDDVPAWHGYRRGRLGRRRDVHLMAWADARRRIITLLGVGHDRKAGETALVERLDAWGPAPPPVILLASGSSSERLWSSVRSVFPSAPAFDVPDSGVEPWRRPAALLQPLEAALRLGPS